MSDNETRNAKVVAMREAGATYKEIGDTFGLTGQWARAICKAHEKETVLNNDELFTALMAAAQKLGRPKPHASAARAYKYLNRYGVHTLLQLEPYTEHDLLKIRNIGVNTFEVIQEAQKAYHSGTVADEPFGDACDELLRRVDKLERINGELCAEVNKLTAERELYRSLLGKAIDYADEIIMLGMYADEGVA